MSITEMVLRIRIVCECIDKSIDWSHRLDQTDRMCSDVPRKMPTMLSSVSRVFIFLIFLCFFANSSHASEADRGSTAPEAAEADETSSFGLGKILSSFPVGLSGLSSFPDSLHAAPQPESDHTAIALQVSDDEVFELTSFSYSTSGTTGNFTQGSRNAAVIPLKKRQLRRLT
jgi:hypothetical protein